LQRAQLVSQHFFAPAKLPSLIASQANFGHLATNSPSPDRHADCTPLGTILTHFQ
jgi:hypothetical protein